MSKKMITLKLTKEECYALMDVLPNTNKKRINDVPFEDTYNRLMAVRNKIIKVFKGMKLITVPKLQAELIKKEEERIRKYGITIRR